MFSKHHSNHSKNGFTVMEVLVVIAIISVLVAIVTASTSGARKNTREKQLKATMAEMRLDAQLYYEKYKNFGTVSFYDNDSNACSGGVALANNTVFKNDDPLGLGLAESVLAVIQVDSTNESRIYCGAQTSSWVFAAPLNNPGQDNNVWCVDSSGYEGEIYINLDVSGTQAGDFFPFRAPNNTSCQTVDKNP